MSANCRRTPKLIQCEPITYQKGAPRVCQPFDVCLPFGRSLHYDGQCVTLTGNPDIPDGEYGIIIVENGCIIGAKPQPVCEYTPPPCTPAAEPCDETGTGTTTLQPDACNLTSIDAAGRLGTYVVVEAGEGIAITGCGTAVNPIRISADIELDASTYIISESTQQITLEGTGSVTDPYVLGLAEVMTGGTYGQFRVDNYGRIIEYVDPAVETIYSVVAGPGIDTDTSNGVVTVSLTETGIDAGRYLLGGYTMAFDLAGRVSEIRQSITLNAGRYDPHDYELEVNEYGSLTDLVPIVRSAVNRAVSHNAVGGDAICDITTDCTGYLYAIWRGYEVLGTVGTDGTADAAGPYTERVADYMTGFITGLGIQDAERFGSIYGKFETRTVTSETDGQSTTYLVLTEWRGRSFKQYPAGTYRVTISLNTSGTGEASLSNISVLEVEVV